MSILKTNRRTGRTAEKQREIVSRRRFVRRAYDLCRGRPDLADMKRHFAKILGVQISITDADMQDARMLIDAESQRSLGDDII